MCVRAFVGGESEESLNIVEFGVSVLIGLNSGCYGFTQCCPGSKRLYYSWYLGVT